MMLFLATLAAAGTGGYAVLGVTGADDDCCAAKVAAALDALPFVDGAAASYETGTACVKLSGALDAAAVGKALADAGYGLGAVTPADACPAGLAIKPADPWTGVTGIDLAHVSNGEAVDLEKALAPGKFTIVDFGATWCAPCFAAADRIEAYARQNPDVAVRAVLLAGADPKASFAQPIVKQHLAFAEGLPYFLAYAPNGKVVYKGSDLDALFAAIGKKRK